MYSERESERASERCELCAIMIQSVSTASAPPAAAAVCSLFTGSLVDDRRTHDLLGDAVRVAVGRRSPVLHVAVAFLGHLARNADRRAAVGDARREVVDVARLMQPGQSSLVVATSMRVVRSDVSVVMHAQLLNRLLDQPPFSTFTVARIYRLIRIDNV